MYCIVEIYYLLLFGATIMLLKLRHDGLDSGRVDRYKSVVTAYLVTYKNGSSARLVPYLVIIRII